MNGFDAEKIAKHGEVWLLDGKPHRIVVRNGSKIAMPFDPSDGARFEGRSLASNMKAKRAAHLERLESSPIEAPEPLTLDSPVRAVLDVLEGLKVTTRQNFSLEETESTELSCEILPHKFGGPPLRLAVVVDGTGPASVLEAYVRLANEVRRVR